jgi:two-component sensor histidine kinase
MPPSYCLCACRYWVADPPPKVAHEAQAGPGRDFFLTISTKENLTSMQSNTFKDQFSSPEYACTLAQAIVDTVREPMIVLDSALRVIAASQSFYIAFRVSPEETTDKPLYELGNAQWDIPGLRALLEQILLEHGTMQEYEVAHDFPELGHRVMWLNARQVFLEGDGGRVLLLGIEDITGRRAKEREIEHRLTEKQVLLEEMEHRIANSLQIIASIILMKARSVESEETRLHLQDAHKRVVSVAAVQQQLHQSASAGRVDMEPYLTRLCASLSTAIIGDLRPIALDVIRAEGTATAREAESLGLIATELVMNALKHAFPEARDHDKCQICIAFDVDGEDWKLTVLDNGIGRGDGLFAQPKTGLGTGIVKALAQQLDAVVETVAASSGTTITITHAIFTTRDIGVTKRATHVV